MPRSAPLDPSVLHTPEIPVQQLQVGVCVFQVRLSANKNHPKLRAQQAKITPGTCQNSRGGCGRWQTPHDLGTKTSSNPNWATEAVAEEKRKAIGLKTWCDSPRISAYSASGMPSTNAREFSTPTKSCSPLATSAGIAAGQLFLRLSDDTDQSEIAFAPLQMVPCLL